MFGQICADGFGDTGFCDIGRRDADGMDEAGIQVVKHMAFVSIDAYAGIVNLFAGMQYIDKLKRGKISKVRKNKGICVATRPV